MPRCECLQSHEGHRAGERLRRRNATACQNVGHLAAHAASGGDAAEVALGVGHKDGHAPHRSGACPEEKEGALIRQAVNASLDANVRTPEIQVEGGAHYGTQEVGQWIVDYIKKS